VLIPGGDPGPGHLEPSGYLLEVKGAGMLVKLALVGSIPSRRCPPDALLAALASRCWFRTRRQSAQPPADPLTAGRRTRLCSRLAVRSNP